MMRQTLCVLTFILFFASPILAAADVNGHLVAGGGKTMQIRLSVSAPPPKAFIVQHQLPAGVHIVNATPKPSGYSQGAASVKWLFKHPGTGSSTITVQLNRPISAGQAPGEIRFQNPSNGAMVSKKITN